ncbi:antibiotic biosynthesis monooxygenase [Hyalangium sp.]|uniref:antibiotic biosynthesis monooxygenase n=1 Tax=Hyalangium sp. TaxID=2028555 RepID=UPI002D4EF3A4|nr:antibiotic biosynthesis monooxygenase [Hyalangium sp.]HYI03234.1 antibiotic biosynthesis monooxygenase [Hyalangium sp.]
MSSSAAEGPVTVIVNRRLKPGTEARCDEWLSGVIADVTRFPGHLGVDVFRPPNADTGDYVLTFRFDTYAHLRAWEESPVRAEWAMRAAEFTVGVPRVRRLTGFKSWFEAPGQAEPPPRLKMALVAVLGIYPLLILVVPTLHSLLHGLPELIAALLSALILVRLMRYAVLPLLTRLLAPWLAPKSPRQ